MYSFERNFGEEIQPFRRICARKYSLSSEKKTFCERLMSLGIKADYNQKSTLLYVTLSNVKTPYICET